MFKTKLIFLLSNYIVTTMDWYEKEGFIERNKFIENSIRNHSSYVTTDSGSNIASPSVGIEVQVSILLALKLWRKALTTRTSISSIVNEALAFSLPCLMEQNQAQEEFRLEIEMAGWLYFKERWSGIDSQPPPFLLNESRENGES